MMRYIDQLLQGAEVEWKKLGEVAEIGTGSSNRQDEVEQGEYPFYVRSKNVLRSTTYQFDETAIIIPGEGGIGDIYHYAEGKYALHQRAYRIHLIEGRLLDKFLFYFMGACFKRYIISKSVVATTTSIRKPMLEQFPIPIPPLHVQQEIVRILDKFTELETELEAKLETELELRKQQYERYRDQLLSPDKGLSETEVEWKKLGEVTEYSSRKVNAIALSKHNYIGVDNLLQNKAGKKDSSYVPTDGNFTAYTIGDVLIGNIRPYLKKIWLANQDGGTNGDVLVIHTTDKSVDAEYLYQVLADDKFFAYNMQYAKGAKMPRGNKQKIMDYLIPIPPLHVQQRIVSVLDKFHTLTTSISEGLPREIELRKQQYAYYRDQLLSFER